MRRTLLRALVLCIYSVCLLCADSHAQADTLGPVMRRELSPLLIEATRAHERTPVTYTDLEQQQIAPLNTGQDLPYILRFTPSLVVTSDAGNGIGYTGLWIRGSDPSRVNISINGIPLNDPESQQVFWVNTPDLASSAGSIQIQRGVGTSSNGAAAFGGLIKIETLEKNRKPYGRVEQAWGSFNSRKHSVQVGSGLLHNRFMLEGRLSRVSSDGYIDRARTDLFGYELNGTLLLDGGELVVTAFGGREETYQSWYGTPAQLLEGAGPEALADFASRNSFTAAQTANLLSSGRTYNFYTYDNQIDHYGQDHLQIHYRKQIGSSWNVNASAHYTRGKGYFEEFRDEDNRSRYGLAPYITPSGADTLDQSDVVRRRWLDNHFYGFVFSARYARDRNLLTIGGAANEYRGDHFGELTWMELAGNTPEGFRYYEGQSLKRDANAYVRYIHDLGQGWDLYGDLQVRLVDYVTAGTDNDLRAYDVQDELLFFNPKAGVNKRIGRGRAYASVALGSKEPNRNDYVDAPEGEMPRPEYMTDVEAGYQWEGSQGFVGFNAFWMDYRDQLVLTGALNDVGAPLRTNVQESYRAGVELEAQYRIARPLQLVSNLTLADHRIRRFDEVIYDYTSGFEVVVVEHRDTPIAFSPRIVATVGGVMRFGENRTKSADSGRAVSSFWELSWMQRYVGQQHLDNTGNEAVVLGAYTTGDAMLAYALEDNRGVSLRINLWVNNVLDAQYSSNGYTFSYIFGERITERFYYPQAGRNVMIGLNLGF